MSYPSISIYLFLSLYGSHLVLIRCEVLLVTDSFTVESCPDKVLLANYMILLTKWHNKFNPKKYLSTLDTRLSAFYTSIPLIKLHSHLFKKYIINDTFAPLSSSLDFSIKIASSLSTFCDLKPDLYSFSFKIIPKIIIISHSSKLWAKAKLFF